jgi:hypothetical protein
MPKLFKERWNKFHLRHLYSLQVLEKTAIFNKNLVDIFNLQRHFQGWMASAISGDAFWQCTPPVHISMARSEVKGQIKNTYRNRNTWPREVLGVLEPSRLSSKK